MEYELSGNSIQIIELNATIKQVAQANISVLITGESGTGKELVANGIYHFSKRRNKPLIKVNCGAIPEGIIESELFGHQRGAFTGAVEERKGYFEMADGGTIFLDEIGEMPLGTQVKILRVLESGEFMKVGGNKNIKVDVRVIAATNRELAKEVMNKNFREDLYFRLKSINLHIPPLRERKSDIILLFKKFTDEFCLENNIIFSGIEEDAMEFITNYVWNGNARELKNFCESIIVLHPNSKLTLNNVKKHLQVEVNEVKNLPAISTYKREQFDKDLIMRALFEIKTDIIDVKSILHNLGMKIFENERINKGSINDNSLIITREDLSELSYNEIEKRILLFLLREKNWNKKEVAKILGQTPRNVYRMIQKYNLNETFN
jgi:transcriptional regulator with GAF, ATPase, and Fis domain